MENDLIYDSFKTIVAGFSREDQEKLFSKNAAAFYRIDLS